MIFIHACVHASLNAYLTDRRCAQKWNWCCRSCISDVGDQHAVCVHEVVSVHTGQVPDKGVHCEWAAHGLNLLHLPEHHGRRCAPMPHAPDPLPVCMTDFNLGGQWHGETIAHAIWQGLLM